jgi:hypothetical protein
MLKYVEDVPLKQHVHNNFRTNLVIGTIMEIFVKHAVLISPICRAMDVRQTHIILQHAEHAFPYLNTVYYGIVLLLEITHNAVKMLTGEFILRPNHGVALQICSGVLQGVQPTVTLEKPTAKHVEVDLNQPTPVEQPEAHKVANIILALVARVPVQKHGIHKEAVTTDMIAAPTIIAVQMERLDILTVQHLLK